MKEIVLFGTNHRAAPLEIRERCSFEGEGLQRGLKDLLSLPEVEEGAILSTCNRVEIYAATGSPEGGLRQIRGFVGERSGLSDDELSRFFYSYTGREAVRHIFRVASSLDSMVVGEPQILGQIKDAYRKAAEEGCLGLLLHRFFQKTFSVAKRVRSSTAIGDRAISVSFVAVELAKRIFRDLGEKVVLVIGAGDMCELAAQYFVRAGVKGIRVTNRTYERAVELAERFGGEAIPFSDLIDGLMEADIVLSSTGSPHYLVRKEEVAAVLRRRKQRPLFFIDIAVPRDIDPEVNNLDNAYLYDIDDLQEVAEANVKDRLKEAQRAEAIIEEEVEKFYRWRETLDVVPTIISLKERMERIREGELRKSMGALSRLSPEEREAVEALTEAIIKKVLHGPIKVLKETSGTPEEGLYVELIRRLFQLED